MRLPAMILLLVLPILPVSAASAATFTPLSYTEMESKTVENLHCLDRLGVTSLRCRIKSTLFDSALRAGLPANAPDPKIFFAWTSADSVALWIDGGPADSSAGRLASLYNNIWKTILMPLSFYLSPRLMEIKFSENERDDEKGQGRFLRKSGRYLMYRLPRGGTVWVDPDSWLVARVADPAPEDGSPRVEMRLAYTSLGGRNQLREIRGVGIFGNAARFTMTFQYAERGAISHLTSVRFSVSPDAKGPLFAAGEIVFSDHKTGISISAKRFRDFIAVMTPPKKRHRNHLLGYEIDFSGGDTVTPPENTPFDLFMIDGEKQFGRGVLIQPVGAMPFEDYRQMREAAVLQNATLVSSRPDTVGRIDGTEARTYGLTFRLKNENWLFRGVFASKHGLMYEIAAWAPVRLSRELDRLFANFSKGFRFLPEGPSYKTARGPSRSHRIEDSPYRLSVPSPPWTKARAERLHRDADLALVFQPEWGYVMVIAERVRTNIVDLEKWGAPRLQNLRVVNRRTGTIGDGAVTELEVKGRLDPDGLPLHYLCAFVSDDEWTLQIFGWSHQLAFGEIGPRIREIVRSLKRNGRGIDWDRGAKDGTDRPQEL